LHLVGILFPHINDNARSKSQQLTGTIFVLTFHILLILISRCLYLLSFSVSLVLMFESSGTAISNSRQVFSFLSWSTVSGQFASIVRSVITGTSHIIVILLTHMALSGTYSYYLLGTCNSICLHIIQWM